MFGFFQKRMDRKVASINEPLTRAAIEEIVLARGSRELLKEVLVIMGNENPLLNAEALDCLEERLPGSKRQVFTIVLEALEKEEARIKEKCLSESSIARWFDRRAKKRKTAHS